MLNLSDKELDRFSKEAAQEYEPGDVLGTRSWDRLDVRLTQEFGPGWNLLRHIRRFPFYYAPALLLLLGVGYYLARPGVSSGSSPGGTAKTPTQKTSVKAQNSVSTDKATSTPATTSATTGSHQDGDGVSGNGANGPAVGKDANGVATGGAVKGGTNGAGATRTESDERESKAATRSVKAGSVAAGSTAAARTINGMGNAGAGRTGTRSPGSGRRGNGHNKDNKPGGAGDNTVTVTAPLNPGRGQRSSNGDVNGGVNGAGITGAAGSLVKPDRELGLTHVQRPRSLGKRGVIGDSALRAYNAKSGAPVLIRKKGIYRINRNWQFGLMIAPDFTSVNSLAGDKAGSSIGLTVDYQFVPHWYLSTGILTTRRNYAARDVDYHAPQTFYQQQGIYGGVSFVKGSFYMMEIPLNLRYDFSVAGNTLFFISAGSSSYLMTTENANLYWHHFNVEQCNPADHLPIHRTNLFSTINLSAGVETGLSNSLSLLIAPYMKLPAKSLGLGQVQMNSVGIDFILKWSPVTSRKRR